MRDPAPLFESEAFNATGALLWPDYWASSAAPDLAPVLGLRLEQMPDGTFESGQMLFRKATCGPSGFRRLGLEP